MIPYKYEVLRPYLHNNMRLACLSSCGDIGTINWNDTYIYERLNNIMERINDDNIHNFHSTLRASRPFPDPDRERAGEALVSSDIQFKDIFRQHREIENRYRRGLPTMADIRLISEPTMKFNWAGSRGFERHLINHMNLLDNEYLNRQSLRYNII